jgi:hypothetical protein
VVNHLRIARAAQTVGYGKVVSHVIIGLKTAKGGKQLKLDPSIYDSLQKEKARDRCWVCWATAKTASINRPADARTFAARAGLQLEKGCSGFVQRHDGAAEPVPFHLARSLVHLHACLALTQLVTVHVGLAL